MLFFIFQVAQFLCDSIVETYKVKYANTAGNIDSCYEGAVLMLLLFSAEPVLIS